MLDIVRVSLIVYINKRKSQLRPFRPTANNSDALGDVCNLENLDKTCGFGSFSVQNIQYNKYYIVFAGHFSGRKD